MPLSEEEITELKSKHGQHLQLEVFSDPTDDEDGVIEIVLKPPTSSAFRRFMDERAGGNVAASTVVQNWVDPHVVYPDATGFKTVVEKLAGVRASLSIKLQDMAGASGARSSKKL